LETQLKEGGKLHLKLNITVRPIVNKYREGKLKSTLKRELKERENDQVEANRSIERYIVFYISANIYIILLLNYFK
jgi:hypothetical protein